MRASNQNSPPEQRHAMYARGKIDWIDVGIILVLGLAAESAHFTWRDGRPILNADSAQYVDAAQALLAPDREADFALRKPGYPFLLAGLALLTGTMTWSSLAANHVLLGLLPIAAYGLGCVMLSRWAGWLAAILTIARLQSLTLGDRIMSEVPYMFLLSFGLLAATHGLSRYAKRPGLSTLGAGMLLAGAWLLRGVALAPIAATVACSVWVWRRSPRRLIQSSVCLIGPLLAAGLFESGLNYAGHGRFRTSTGSLGMMLMMRTRHVQVLPMTGGEAGRRAQALLPERSADDAYRGSELDTWVARYRAVHDWGLDEWETDSLMREAARGIIADHPIEFLRYSAGVFASHVLRREIPFNAPGPAEHGLPCVRHPAGGDDPEFEWNWWAYWGLPHRTVEASREFAAELTAVAEARAPFAHVEPLPTLRYLSLTPVVASVTESVSAVAAVWPGLAVAMLVFLCRARAGCILIALACLLDASLISLCCPSGAAALRYQSVWLATDTALIASALSLPVQMTWARLTTGCWRPASLRFTAAWANPI